MLNPSCDYESSAKNQVGNCFKYNYESDSPDFWIGMGFFLQHYNNGEELSLSPSSSCTGDRVNK